MIAGTKVEEETLDDFLYAVPPEDKDQFDKLATVLEERLSGVKVYKIGDEAEASLYRGQDHRWTVGRAQDHRGRDVNEPLS